MLLRYILPAGTSHLNYLFKTESLAKEFKKRYLKKLRKEFDKGKLCFPGGATQSANRKHFEQLLIKAGKKKWIAYSKAPFGGPEQVLEYLGRYTHRVAITNNRIQSIDNGIVTFSYRDRSDDNKVKELTLPVEEFIRRFLLHILPNGFMKIRYFGFLAHTNKRKSIPLLRQLIGSSAELPEKIEETVQEMMLRLTGEDISTCPKCKKGLTGVVCPFYTVGPENRAGLCLFQQKKQKRILDAWETMVTCRNSHPKPASLSYTSNTHLPLNTHRKTVRKLPRRSRFSS